MCNINYYEENAKEYCEKTARIDMSREREIFKNFIYNYYRNRNTLRIVDLGCGSGRDTEYFSREGHIVTPVDISQEMLNRTFVRTGIRGIRENFEDRIYNVKHCHGVWACASLVHTPKHKLTKVLNNIHEILLPDGIVYISLKKGSGEFPQYDGRTFTYWQLDELLLNIKSSDVPYNILAAWESVGNHSEWVNIILKRKERKLFT